MADIDHVFARFHDNHVSSPHPQRELLSIPRKGSSNSSRTVEVVHVRSGLLTKSEQRPKPASAREAARFDEFPAKRDHGLAQAEAAAPPKMPQQPTVHIMPMWQPSETEATADASTVAKAEDQLRVRGRGRPPKASSSSADPFNADDDGANCMRCGYVVEAAREKRGMMTCAKCA